MQSLIVLWYTGSGRLSRLIQAVTRSTFSHTAIMVDGVLYEALGSGIKRLEGKAATVRAAQAIAHKHLPVHRQDLVQVKQWLDEQEGNGYSILGFIMAGLQSLTGYSLVVALPGEYICSGLVAKALQIAGYIWNVEARTQSPASLALLIEPNDLPWTEPRLPSQEQLERESQRKQVVVKE